MKQKDLHYPHTWLDRRPAIEKRVLFVPDFYFEHAEFTMPEFSHSSLFGNSHPVYIEYCSGNGEWIIEKAKENPQINWFAVEKKFNRVRKIWAKAMQAGLVNLIVVAGDAREFTHYYLKRNQIDAIFINFPDPWPKDKHAKHRLIQSDFVASMQKVLKPSKEVTIVTDDPDYTRQVIDEMQTEFDSAFPDPYYIEKSKTYGSSYFNRLFEGMGRRIHFMQFQNTKRAL